jgi:hypothetical protein
VLPTLPTVFNGTETYIRDTSDNISSLTSETSVSNEATFSTDWNDTGDKFKNADMEDILDGYWAFIDELASTSLSVNVTEVKDGIFNSTVGRLDIASSYFTDGSGAKSDVTVSNVESTTFEVSETDLDNTSDIFADNFTNTESIPPSNFVPVTNSTVDEDSESYGLSSVTESEELTSDVVTTLETSLSQGKGSVSTGQYIDHRSQMIHETSAGVAVSTECSSSECRTLSTDGTASSWESSFAPDATSDTRPAAIFTETTSTSEESHGMRKIKVTVRFQNMRMNSEQAAFRVNLTVCSTVLDNLIVAKLATRFPIPYGT